MVEKGKHAPPALESEAKQVPHRRFAAIPE